jgi:hypothetical protein
MIWATWRLNRSVFISSIVVAVALAIWLATTGAMEANSWAVFTGHHCSIDFPGSSLVCMNSLSGVGNFSTVNAALCGALPALLGLVLGVPLVASEIQQGTNRLAWTQSITRTRWLFVKIGVGALFTAVIVGALAPLVWWWTDAAQRSHIQPANFDISGAVEVAYALFAFMLGVALGTLIRRSGWAFAACVPIFALVRAGVRLYVRPGLVSPATLAPGVRVIRVLPYLYDRLRSRCRRTPEAQCGGFLRRRSRGRRGRQGLRQRRILEPTAVPELPRGGTSYCDRRSSARPGPDVPGRTRLYGES